jgi:hypothetical protein
MLLRGIAPLAALACLLAITGCGGETGTGFAQVRAFNAMGDTAVHVVADLGAVGEAIGPGQGTAFLNVPAVPQDVVATSLAGGAPIDALVEPFARGTRTTLIVAGRPFTPTPRQMLSLVEESLAVGLPPLEQTRLRLLHFSSLAGPVDVYLTAPEEPWTAGHRRGAALGFGSVGPFFDVPLAGIQPLRVVVTPAGIPDLVLAAILLPPGDRWTRSVVVHDAGDVVALGTLRDR